MATRETQTQAYRDRLETLSGARWKRLLGVQSPYRWHLQRLDLGFVADIGCGIGRNLEHLGGCGVGVDSNPACVETARERGLTAYSSDTFHASEFARPGRFDSLLFSHVLEHMESDAAVELVETHLPYLRQGGKVVFITPQEAGFRSDPTHVEFMDTAALKRIATRAGLIPGKSYSFPFPRPVGRIFRHNEFVVLAHSSHST